MGGWFHVDAPAAAPSAFPSASSRSPPRTEGFPTPEGPPMPPIRLLPLLLRFPLWCLLRSLQKASKTPLPLPSPSPRKPDPPRNRRSNPPSAWPEPMETVEMVETVETVVRVAVMPRIRRCLRRRKRWKEREAANLWRECTSKQCGRRSRAKNDCSLYFVFCFVVCVGTKKGNVNSRKTVLDRLHAILKPIRIANILKEKPILRRRKRIPLQFLHGKIVQHARIPERLRIKPKKKAVT